MSKVMQLWRNAMSSSKKATEEAKFDVMYPTGFISVDYLNGTIVHVRSDIVNMDYRALGIVDGTANTIISRPGAGKSTLVTQWIGNLLRSHPDCEAFIDDIEGSLPTVRKEFLLGLSKKDINERVYIRNEGITTENVYDQIRLIHDTKKANRKDLEQDTGLYDTEGNRIIKMQPTFYFIDSLAMLLPNEINDDEDMEGNKNAAMSVAKKSTMFIKKIAQLLKPANIVLFTINHIMDDVQMGPFAKPQQVEGLKPGERLPGGRAALYLANNMFRLDKKKTLKEDEVFGIPGTVVEFSICKSRTNANLRGVPLVFDKSVGLFDNELSAFYYLKEAGFVGGAGRSLFFIDHAEIKFSQKGFKSDLATNIELQKAFVDTCNKAFSELLSDTLSQSAIPTNNGGFDLNKAMMETMAA